MLLSLFDGYPAPVACPRPANASAVIYYYFVIDLFVDLFVDLSV
jgi:hypothetical protein